MPVMSKHEKAIRKRVAEIGAELDVLQAARAETTAEITDRVMVKDELEALLEDAENITYDAKKEPAE